MRLLLSVLMFGTASFPACRMTQPASEESNSLVKNRGSGVDVSSRVDVGAGVSVNGMDVGASVAVGKSGATGVAVAGWQAVVRIKHPIRSFFIVLITKCRIMCKLEVRILPHRATQNLPEYEISGKT